MRYPPSRAGSSPVLFGSAHDADALRAQTLLRLRTLKLRWSIVFAALCWIIGVALLVQAWHIKPALVEPMGPETYPAIIALLMVVSASYNLLVDFANLRKLQPGGVSSAPAPSYIPTLDDSAWKTPLAVGMLGVVYVAGLTFVGFFVPTFCFTLLTMAALHHFERRPGLVRQTLSVYLALSVAIVAALVLAVKFLRIYIPAQTWL